jgi:ubiquinone biosynthesis protein
MHEQVGWRGFVDRVKREGERWSAILPELPRLTHAALERSGRVPAQEAALRALLEQVALEQQRSRRWIQVLVVAILVLAFLK